VESADVKASRHELVTVAKFEVELSEQLALFGVAADRTSESRLLVRVVRDVIDVMVRTQDMADRRRSSATFSRIGATGPPGRSATR